MSAYLSMIPDAVHLCPGCGDLTEGEELCVACRNATWLSAKLHAARADALFSELPRETGRMPEDSRFDPECVLVLLGAIAVSVLFWGCVAAGLMWICRRVG